MFQRKDLIIVEFWRIMEKCPERLIDTGKVRTMACITPRRGKIEPDLCQNVNILFQIVEDDPKWLLE